MARKLSPVQKRKKAIRLRDRRKFKKRFVCTVCSEIKKTEIHHWYYCDHYDPIALIEVCRECHEGLHELARAKKPKAKKVKKPKVKVNNRNKNVRK